MKRLNLKEKCKAFSVRTLVKNTKDSLRSRSFRVGGYSVMATVLVAAIVVAVNVLVNALPEKYTKFDTTSTQLFTISEQTEKILAGLDQEVTIYWVVQKGYEDSTLETLLERYESMSDKIHVEKKDPDVYPTFVRQYFEDSATNNSLVIESGERYRTVDNSEIYVYDYSNYYYDGTYTVEFAGENALTSAIDYVVSEDLPKMYLLTGHGEATLSSDVLEEVERGNIETEDLSLLTVDEIPEDADCILVYAPQSDISETEKEMLLTWLQAGGKMILLTSPLESGDRLTNLEAVMEYYGVTAAEGIVLESDRNHYIYGYPYYLLPDMESHTITTPLIDGNYYAMIWLAQGLVVSDDLRSGLSVDELLVTSDSAFSKLAGYEMETYDKEEGDIDGPFALAVAINETVESGEQTQIVWVSSADLLSTQLQNGAGNENLFLNCVNWICEKEDSIAISAKSLEYDYLTISSGEASTWTIMVVGLIPLSYLVIGIITWVRRRRR